jgi:hypothetical protein
MIINFKKLILNNLLLSKMLIILFKKSFIFNLISKKNKLILFGIGLKIHKNY